MSPCRHTCYDKYAMHTLHASHYKERANRQHKAHGFIGHQVVGTAGMKSLQFTIGLLYKTAIFLDYAVFLWIKTDRILFNLFGKYIFST